MAIDREKLVKKIKEMPQEERTLFREALREADPENDLSSDELSALREMLKGTGEKKGGKKVMSTLEKWLGE